MLVIAGSVKKKVIIVLLSVLFPLKMKRIRAILKLLIIVIWDPSYILYCYARMIPSQERVIMIKSKILHES